ncbi:hypothetical protein ALC57_12168 [Trachymyrmex cornetzi]|uniref:HAT C-terminal dimerisation domain-containing protein n=1 Tax=Trachymyrmex cornetzi TaxID=471704 RepID=A0A195DRX4_9HYME|nr:hypothetical protein ALC57_12168 [Trachymyrmex cornetzi]
MIEIKLCMHVAAHNSIKSVDHLTDLLKECGKGSDLEKLRLHRTKTSMIILKVISPAILKEIIEDIGEEPFSIILDESTDVSVVKYMAYCVRYFNKRLNIFVVDFLGFSEIYEATAENFYEYFKAFMSEVGLNYENMIGLGTNGASSLCGKNYSLYTLLKQEIPHLQLIQCVCHSLNLCASNASDELPCTVEYLLRETRKWFSHNSLRQMRYSKIDKIYQLINAGKRPPKLIQLSSTRWLSWSEVVSTNIKQWLELKQHFQLVAKSQDDKCYTARTLAQMYEDDSNLLYLLFLDGILKEVTNINLAFQKTNADITKLYTDLHMLIVSLARRIIKPSYLRHQETEKVHQDFEKVHQDFEKPLLPLESVDFGYQFESYAAKKTISQASLKLVQERSLMCTECAPVQSVKYAIRLSRNLPVVENLRYLTPEMCLNPAKTSYRNLPWKLAGKDLDRNVIESQFRRLQTLRIHEISSDFNNNINITDFWIAVRQMTNANGEKCFKDLTELVFRALSFPISNAAVERIFSIMAVVKSKLRNRLTMPILVALMRTRIHLNVLRLCCKNYCPTPYMLKLFNSLNIYEVKSSCIQTELSDYEDSFLESLTLIESVESINQ